MDDTRTGEPSPQVDHRAEPGQHRTAWDRALDGPPINPRPELIYHDRKTLRSRHS